MAAVTSGRLTDAVQNLLDWLAKAELYLAEDQPILGDLDTVNVLIEKHKVPTLLLTCTQSTVGGRTIYISLS